MAEKFHLLKYGLAFVLTFIGVKMLLPLVGQIILWSAGEGATGGTIDFVRRFVNHEFAQETINISLAVVGIGILSSVILSLIITPKAEAKAETAEGLE
jgi:predicted tellurium resistance membrane protein TerC